MDEIGLFSPSRVGLLLVDDQAALRQEMARIFAQEPGFGKIHEASSADEALKMLSAHDPEVGLIDATLRDENSLELVRLLRIRKPGFRVLLLTLHDERPFVERALRAGVRGCVSKWSRAPELVAAVNRVLAGDLCLPGKDAQPMVREIDVRQALTARETEVLRLLGEGYDGHEIAVQLSLSPKTIEVYLCNVRRKLRLEGLLELHHNAHHLFGPWQRLT